MDNGRMDEFDTRKPMNLRKRGIYLLPNLFTTGALFAGFYAIVQAMNGHFEHSAVAIFIAMVLDGLDGRVARLTHTQSEFGAEYDSLSDMVSFGVAPALVVYEWALKGLGKWGWFAAFIYCAATALRLARFFGNSERFWLNLQTTYDIEREKDILAGRLSKEVQIFAKAS